MTRTLAAVLISGIFLVGCAAPVAHPGATPTEGTFVPTATTAPPTPLRTYTLSGTVFFDYNGNGSRNEGEPPIEGVAILVAGLSTTSGPDGSYSLAGVPAGTQQLHVERPNRGPEEALKYISLSLGAFQTIEEPIMVSVGENTQLNIGLMQEVPDTNTYT